MKRFFMGTCSGEAYKPLHFEQRAWNSSTTSKDGVDVLIGFKIRPARGGLVKIGQELDINIDPLNQ